MTEDQLEQMCLAWFAQGGWGVAHGLDGAPEAIELILEQAEVLSNGWSA